MLKSKRQDDVDGQVVLVRRHQASTGPSHRFNDRDLRLPRREVETVAHNGYQGAETFPAPRKSTHFFNKITSLGHGFNKFFCHHLPQSARWVSNLFLVHYGGVDAASVLRKGFCNEPAAGLLTLVRGVAAKQGACPLVASVGLNSNDTECFPGAMGEWGDSNGPRF